METLAPFKVYRKMIDEKTFVLGNTILFPDISSRNKSLELANNGKHLSYISVIVVPHYGDDLMCTPICTCGSNQHLNLQLLRKLTTYCTLRGFDLDWGSKDFKDDMASAISSSSSLCIHAE